MNYISTFQNNVKDWTTKCFGEKIANDKLERCYRFTEESLELVQSTGFPKEEAQKVLDYVYSRPIGEVNQEVGGSMITLASFCNAFGIDMDKVSTKSLEEVRDKIDKIREKQKTKPIRAFYDK